ncbi:hypothetical protein D0864_13872, partial [Hortaea werneckii]
MAAHAKPPPPVPNGVLTGAPNAGGNRKKQKRRAKQAAKQAAHVPFPTAAPSTAADLGYDEDPLAVDDDSEEELDEDQYESTHAGPNGFASPPPLSTKKNRKKKKPGVSLTHNAYNPDMLPPMPNPPPPSAGMLRSAHRSHSHGHGDIWNTSSAQERQNIKDFWLSLSEEERKSLLKIEKEAVLRKMKQQQKHSCSCTVCGRKRTAIEEELEVLYEGYYEELEQYAHHDQPPLPSSDGLMPDPLHHHRPPHPLAAPPPMHPQHRTSNVREHFDDDEEEYSDEEEEEYSDEEDYSDEEPEPPRGVPDFFNFGQNLTVKGILTPWLEKLQQGLKGKADNLLTVADDLLKNDGRKFIEMMEQLAERRMQRETEAEYAAANPSHPGAYAPTAPGYVHEDPLAAGDEYDDDEASYDSQEEYDDDMEEEDEMGGLTEEQRMQEGRRMFQIFAARMFEQRVLTAYREKVAAERQAKLLEELQDEDKVAAEREAKKARDAAKKKEKKRQQQQAKAEEKARKEAEKAAQEALAREAEEKKQEEQRRKKEEQRKKREEEKRKAEEERQRKEAEKTRRMQQEQERREEAERKQREQRAMEKARKEEARKREKDEREAREKEARDKKAQEEKERKEREMKAKAEREAKEREKSAQQGAPPPQPARQQPPQMTKRPSQMGIAVPNQLQKQTSSGISSPHPPIATPAMPKAPTPNRQRQASQQGSHASSPRQTAASTSSVPSKSTSPSSSIAQQQNPQPNQPRSTVPKPSHPQMGPPHPMQTSSPLNQGPMQPPPGMPHPNQLPGGFGGMSHMGFSGFAGQQGPMMHGHMGQRGPMPMMPHPGAPPMGMPQRMSFPNANGMPPPPPGMMPQGRGGPFGGFEQGFGQVPPGFGQPQMPNHSPLSQPSSQMQGIDPRQGVPTHSRQQSTSDKDRFESTANQPIARPAPIQRPSSVKPQNRNGVNEDVENLSRHLGSSALLDDADEPLPTSVPDGRRTSGMRNGAAPGFGSLGGLGSPAPGFGPAPNWSTPQPFGQPPGFGQQPWAPPLGGPPMGGWSHNQNAFAANGAFGNLAGTMHRAPGNRALNVRLA